MQFVQPILNKNDDINLIKNKYLFGVHVWNIATLREKDEEIFQTAKKKILEITSDLPEISQSFDKMIQRKEEMFAEHKVIIIDIEIQKIRGPHCDLTVIVSPLLEGS